jgi:octaprenyl-diphosphate synthase
MFNHTNPLEVIAPQLDRVQEKFLTLFSTSLPLAQEYLFKLARNPGKRIRPALLLLSAGLFNPVAGEDEEIIDLACVIESVHWASLMHDDVVDNAPRRRGKITFNKEKHNKFSVILADYLLSQAFKFLSRLKEPRYFNLLTQAAADMALGQLEEMQHQGKVLMDQPTYFNIIKHKTAALFSAACVIGAIAGGAKAAKLQCMAEFGLNLGMAFQITDDALDFWGDARLLGKPVGGDLREGKQTLPVIVALSRATPAEQEFLKSALKGAFSKKIFAEVLKILQKCRSKEIVYRYAGEFIKKAEKFIIGLKGSEPLIALAGYVLGREK